MNFAQVLSTQYVSFWDYLKLQTKGVTKTVQWNKHKCTGPGSSAVAAILLAALGDLQLCITRLISAGSAFPHTSHLIEWLQTEMQKAASMASMLVLIFSPPVLIFEHPAQNVVN